jgi:putative PLP-dependent aminotransferase (TIGR04422 family)
MTTNLEIWPYPRITSPTLANERNKSLEKKLYKEIEVFFSNKFKANVVLFPSGRSCLSAIFRVENASRGDSIFAPPWSSHCVWDVISRYSTPTSTHQDEKVKIALNVHRYGYEHKLPSSIDTEIVIEDSVDTLFTKEKKHSSKYEIISLPKVYSSLVGGLIICNDTGVINKLKELQNENIELSTHQFKLRIRELIKTFTDSSLNSFEKWYTNEWNNFNLDINALTNIKNCIDNESNILNNRREKIIYLKEHLKYPLLFDIDENSSRLPLHAILKDSLSDQSSLLVRNISTDLTNSYDSFAPKVLVPLHQGLAMDKFKELIARINSL